jgi:hypothetical protein
MTDKPIEINFDARGLNIEGVPNVPICPLCTTVLEKVEEGYMYARKNPDTRWFWCPTCECHLGYHRMKSKWLVDPYDLDKSNKVREHFGLEPVEQQ